MPDDSDKESVTLSDVDQPMEEQGSGFKDGEFEDPQDADELESESALRAPPPKKSTTMRERVAAMRQKNQQRAAEAKELARIKELERQEQEENKRHLFEAIAKQAEDEKRQQKEAEKKKAAEEARKAKKRDADERREARKKEAAKKREAKKKVEEAAAMAAAAAAAALVGLDAEEAIRKVTESPRKVEQARKAAEAAEKRATTSKRKEKYVKGKIAEKSSRVSGGASVSARTAKQTSNFDDDDDDDDEPVLTKKITYSRKKMDSSGDRPSPATGKGTKRKEIERDSAPGAQPLSQSPGKKASKKKRIEPKQSESSKAPKTVKSRKTSKSPAVASEAIDSGPDPSEMDVSGVPAGSQRHVPKPPPVRISDSTAVVEKPMASKGKKPSTVQIDKDVVLTTEASAGGMAKVANVAEPALRHMDTTGSPTLQTSSKRGRGRPRKSASQGPPKPPPPTLHQALGTQETQTASPPLAQGTSYAVKSGSRITAENGSRDGKQTQNVEAERVTAGAAETPTAKADAIVEKLSSTQPISGKPKRRRSMKPATSIKKKGIPVQSYEGPLESQLDRLQHNMEAFLCSNDAIMNALVGLDAKDTEEMLFHTVSGVNGKSYSAANKKAITAARLRNRISEARLVFRHAVEKAMWEEAQMVSAAFEEASNMEQAFLRDIVRKPKVDGEPRRLSFAVNEQDNEEETSEDITENDAEPVLPPTSIDFQKTAAVDPELDSKADGGKENSLLPVMSNVAEVKKFAGSSYEQLGLSDYRMQTILKLCQKLGALSAEEMHKITPFGVRMIRTKLDGLLEKGFMLEKTKVKDNGQPIRMYTISAHIAEVE